MLDGLDHFWRARLWDDLSKLPPEERGKTLPYIHQMGRSRREAFGRRRHQGFQRHDGDPRGGGKTVPRPRLRDFAGFAGGELPRRIPSPVNDPDKPFEHIAYTVPWNMAENPAISINGGYDANGFPIGVQIVGRRFDDLGVLGMAKTFEGLRGPQRPWPSPPKK